MFENDPAYEKFTRLKQEKLNNQLFLAEFHSSTHDNAFAFQTKAHLFASPSHQLTLNSALQRALKHFNNACSTTRGSISSDPVDVTITSRSTTKVKNKKGDQFSKQNRLHIKTSLFPMTDRKSTILNSFLIRPTYRSLTLAKHSHL